MITKSLQFREIAQASLIRGVDTLADAVGATLGPKGMNAAFDRGFDEPRVVHDGVSVAKEIYLKDPFENMGAQLVRGAATRTNEVGGDGTTTATVLARALVKNGFEKIRSGYNRADLTREVNEAVSKILRELSKMAKPIAGKRQIAEVARISAQSKVIGDMVASVVDKVGVDGVITVEEGSQMDSSYRVTNGMEFDKGYLSGGFITNLEGNGDEAIISDAYILLYDGRIFDESEILEFIQGVLTQTNKKIVIIAEHVEGNALRFLVQNKLKGVLKTIAVRTPGFGEATKKNLADIAALTGATVITEDTGIRLGNVKFEHLGKAEKVVSTEKTTKIVGGMGDKKEIKKREAMIRKDLADAEDDWHRDQAQKRLARFIGAAAVITAGGATEVEMGETKERIIDAVGATQAAIEQGVIQGGETALLVAARIVFDKPGLNAGESIVAEACTAPFIQLLQNAAIDPSSVIIPDKLKGQVFDIMDDKGKWKSATKSGIIDPVKVTIAALTNAASAANSILSTGVIITDDKDQDEQQ